MTEASRSRNSPFRRRRRGDWSREIHARSRSCYRRHGSLTPAFPLGTWAPDGPLLPAESTPASSLGAKQRRGRIVYSRKRFIHGVLAANASVRVLRLCERRVALDQSCAPSYRSRNTAVIAECPRPSATPCPPAKQSRAAADRRSPATCGAMIPPSLWPTSAIRDPSISGRARRYATPARMSSAKSSDVAVGGPASDPLTPRSSRRRTAIPRRPSVSASSRNGR